MFKNISPIKCYMLSNDSHKEATKATGNECNGVVAANIGLFIFDSVFFFAEAPPLERRIAMWAEASTNPAVRAGHQELGWGLVGRF